MAEGWARHLKGDRFDAYSAGVKPSGLNQDAVRVMAEAGVDISGQPSHFDYVITVCDDARESCPVFSGRAKVIHRSFDDPPLAQNARTEAERLEPYHLVRDEIREFIATLPEGLSGGATVNTVDGRDLGTSNHGRQGGIFGTEAKKIISRYKSVARRQVLQVQIASATRGLCTQEWPHNSQSI
jgi:arsenate reductase